MPTGNIFIAHPTNIDQINALKAIVKAFNIKFEISKESDSIENEFIEQMDSSLKQVKQMQKGELAKQSAKDFLNEL